MQALVADREYGHWSGWGPFAKYGLVSDWSHWPPVSLFLTHGARIQMHQEDIVGKGEDLSLKKKVFLQSFQNCSCFFALTGPGSKVLVADTKTEVYFVLTSIFAIL